jgi:hypothetical protein
MPREKAQGAVLGDPAKPQQSPFQGLSMREFRCATLLRDNMDSAITAV